MKRIAVLAITALIATGCTTTGHFKIPKGSELYVYKKPQPEVVASDGSVTSKPFFWTAAGLPPGGGIPYRLEKNGKTIEEGKLRAKFRVVSIFWPPAALIYWPIGFNPDITYDLITHKQE